ncbi:ferritin-like domain-containing protein [Rhodothermus profundi]|uniref:Bacterioferritin n=1 Tax=Rhodothermus profundi TaxID=633813 RepID=A0A1M6URQ5_9BACT|nr:ferritin-like domain-containing protein [Rhodothermus profundi]SHK71853.1 bacterioferritin [Rhodothermus profundi]
METEIKTVTREQLIKGLNEDLAHEYQAIVMYATYAAMASGIHRPFLKEFFEREIPEELRHAQFLANKITALGGLPTTKPAPVKLADSNRAMLEAVLKAEEETIARYVQRRKQAEALGDYGLVNDLEEIISDETRHKEETEKLLRGIGEH